MGSPSSRKANRAMTKHIVYDGTATIEDGVDDLKLYLLTQDTLNGYDVYDGAVVCAKDEDDARTIHPSGCVVNHSDCCGDMCLCYDDWPEPHLISVRLIGVAVNGTKRGLICASFNAG